MINLFYFITLIIAIVVGVQIDFLNYLQRFFRKVVVLRIS